jgi:hypothetical protein
MQKVNVQFKHKHIIVLFLRFTDENFASCLVFMCRFQKDNLISPVPICGQEEYFSLLQPEVGGHLPQRIYFEDSAVSGRAGA